MPRTTCLPVTPSSFSSSVGLKVHWGKSEASDVPKVLLFFFSLDPAGSYNWKCQNPRDCVADGDWIDAHGE